MTTSIATIRRRLPTLIAIVGMMSCILAIMVASAYFFLLPQEAKARTLVLFHAPLNGDQLEVGQISSIHATARDENNVTRMELWIDGELTQVETSRVPGGISPFPLVTNWEPIEVGRHTLTVRAFNSRGERAQASVNIETFEPADRDDDGVTDEDDACPDDTAPTSDGCPLSDDRDNDGLADEEDACPDEAGWADIDGCPTPDDSDGDGVLDEEDACPDERGLSDVEGCPDADGDSVPDGADADPGEPGPVDDGGAPGFDDEPAPDGSGAPEGGDPGLDIPDSDGDGASDDVDPCPHEYGEPEDSYCPPPESDPAPEDDGPIFEPPGGFFDEVEIPINIEIEAYEFSVSGEYDNVWCYVQLAEGAMQRYEFEPEGENRWNIRDVLGGANSVHLVAFWGEPLPVFINCGADNIYHEEVSDEDDGVIQDAGGWGTVYDLGTHSVSHSSLEWDGRELLATGIGPDGESFLGRYRICSPTCDETALQPPILENITLGPRGEGPYLLHWRWDGNEDWIDGFGVLVNGTLYGTMSRIAPDRRTLDIGTFLPACGEVLEFQIFAYGGNSADGTYRESPNSNTLTWDGEACPRSVLVTFLSLDTTGMGGRQGPISGTFYANDQMLIADYRDRPPSFDATDDTERYLDTGRFYDIATLFSEIETEARSCIGSGCTRNYAPSTTSIEVELGPHEALTFGARIWREGGMFFNGDAYVPEDMIVPGEYVVYDNGINMTVLVDVLVGPEAGGPEHLPDLTITDVTAEESSGQLRIHVFNNASDLVDEDISVNLVRMSTNEQITLYTWENVTIPSGGFRILQSGILDIEPYDLRVILDPDNAIRETDDGNNIYETPVRMHVEFTRLGWGAPCEFFLDTGDAEYRFRMWVGHLSPDGEATWIAERRHPWSGTVDVDIIPYEEWEYNEEDWVLAGNPLFSFEFDMPADHSLVIMADGYEDDPGLGADDYAGRVYVTYPREMNYGDSPDQYHYASEGWHECRDAEPISWDENNFHIYWRINRIH